MKIKFFVLEDEENTLKCSLERESYTYLDTSYNVRLKSTFYLKGNEYVLEDDDTVIFTVGHLTSDKDFYELDREIFDINNSIFIHRSLIRHINHKHLVHNGRISILKKLSNLISSDIFIAPDEFVESNEIDMLLPWTKYQELVNRFPKSTELIHYANARIANIVKDYLDLNEDYDEKFEKYLSKKRREMNDKSHNERILFGNEIDNQIVEREIGKYTVALNKLKTNIESDSYRELNWEEDILNILVLIFPQYKLAIKELTISNNKRIDFVLVDLLNNIDLIEIKTHTRKIFGRKYRGNYAPSVELSGSIMQIEKYIYDLTSDITKNTDLIKNKIADSTVDVSIVNPKGFIIIGRTNDLNEQQKKDYRVIKNKYSNIVSIYSYDELIEMLESLIDRFNNNKLDITD
ncbi:Shedu immune nuclease family protein [Staphylococcus agnetis]|uniref:Shedu immune nuclease family protein n=1 Tax=Staphylococcus agnetis TaxID=985762 RepID=UPI000CD2C671|nr:Shedu immune nuclease family protein [Staphylococcus agnetis]PNY85031.1 hypothetical protein CD172_09230 [Staphylococcus agnetis]